MCPPGALIHKTRKACGVSSKQAPNEGLGRAKYQSPGALNEGYQQEVIGGLPKGMEKLAVVRQCASSWRTEVIQKVGTAQMWSWDPGPVIPRGSILFFLHLKCRDGGLLWWRHG